MEKVYIFLHRVCDLTAQITNSNYVNGAEKFPFYNSSKSGDCITETLYNNKKFPFCNSGFTGDSTTETFYVNISNIPTCRIETAMFNNDDMSDFSIKMRNMRLDCNMTAAELSNKTGVNTSTISRYENNLFSYDKINIDILSTLSVACGQDEDYLLTPFLKFKKYHKQILQQYLIENNLSKKQLAELCGVSYTLVKSWFNKEKRSPSYELWQTTFMDYTLNWFEQFVD